MSKKILLVGGNFINKGAEAMLKTVRHVVNEHSPNSVFYAVVTADQTKVAEQSGFIPVSPVQSTWWHRINYLRSAIQNRLAKVLPIRPLPFADRTPLAQLKKAVTELDLAIDVSGYAYHDERGYLQPLETIKAMEFARSKGAAYLFMPQAWGSFKNKYLRATLLKMLERADFYYARDEVSQGYLAEVLDKPVEAIELCPDIAFGLPHPEAELGRQLLLGSGWDGQQKLVAISPNMRVYERFNGRGADNSYVQMLMGLVQYILGNGRYHVVFIPNEIKVSQLPGQTSDDRHLCKVLYDLTADPERSYLFDRYMTAEEVKSIIGHSELLVASRFHSLIFGLSQGIPSMAISWSHKYKELFRLFKMEDLVLEDAHATAEQSIELFQKMESNEASYRKMIADGNQQIQARINAPFERMRKQLG